MKTLMLRNGDLVPSRRDYVKVAGAGKVAQDLRCAMLEPLGNDRFHPGWGSILDRFIGGLADEQTRFEVESEINRVIANYASVQRDKIEADIVGGDQTRFSTAEILSRIQDVRVALNTETVGVTIVLRTEAGETIVLTEAVA